MEPAHDYLALRRPWLDDKYQSWVSFADGRVQRSETRAVLLKEGWDVFDAAVKKETESRWSETTKELLASGFRLNIPCWDHGLVEFYKDEGDHKSIVAVPLLIVHSPASDISPFAERKLWLSRLGRFPVDPCRVELASRRVVEKVEEIIGGREEPIGLIVGQMPVAFQDPFTGQLGVVACIMPYALSLTRRESRRV